jgi:hypothetical protein
MVSRRLTLYFMTAAIQSGSEQPAKGNHGVSLKKNTVIHAKNKRNTERKNAGPPRICGRLLVGFLLCCLTGMGNERIQGKMTIPGRRSVR